MVSITKVVVGELTRILLRKRLSRGSVDRQTAQVHPIIGTPELVPDPKKVICNSGTFTQQIYYKWKGKDYVFTEIRQRVLPFLLLNLAISAILKSTDHTRWESEE